ncbi:MAG: GNAT family N-acetyltransferase [Bacteroidetes bacterium]|nr:GNAT family N-acetyltransferase [Bacteroidota bacterium]
METENKSVQIIDYNPSHHEAFRKINIDWIKDKFVVEDVDEEVLGNPDKYILSGGGRILMAECEGKLVGTCALINEGDNVYELTKMGVDKTCRGLKIGQLLGEATLQKAKELGAVKVILFSNTKGSENAISLYRKLGFKEIPLDHAAYARADIKMEIVF